MGAASPNSMSTDTVSCVVRSLPSSFASRKRRSVLSQAQSGGGQSCLFFLADLHISTCGIL